MNEDIQSFLNNVIEGELNLVKNMTLRDYFAAKVLPECYSTFWNEVRLGNFELQDDWRIGIAIDSYMMADAMMSVRNKGLQE